MQDYQERGVETDVVCIGSKGLTTCQRIGLNVIASVVNLGDTPRLELLVGSLTELFKRYEQNEIDIIHIVYSGFVNNYAPSSLEWKYYSLLGGILWRQLKSKVGDIIGITVMNLHLLLYWNT